MKVAVLVLLIVAAGIGAEWTYRSFLRPVEPLAPEVIALTEYLNRSGISVRPYPVRHGFRHSEVLSVATLEIKDFPLPISVDVCPTDQAADIKLSAIKQSPNVTNPKRLGRLVVYLPLWGDDTAPMAHRISKLLDSYAQST